MRGSDTHIFERTVFEMGERPKNGSKCAQTFENMVISRVENGALSVSKLIPTR